MILVAGPYRSGTNDDPVLMAKNLERLGKTAFELYELGHIPVIGEWLALPLIKLAGSKKAGDEIYNSMSYPIAHRVLTKCDAIMRIEGASKGADQDVEVARGLGLTVYYDIHEVPDVNAKQ